MSNGGMQLIIFNCEMDQNGFGKDRESGEAIVNFNRRYWLGQRVYKNMNDPYIVVQTYADRPETGKIESIDYASYPEYRHSFFISLKNDDDLPVEQKNNTPVYQAGRLYCKTYIDTEIKRLRQIQKGEEPSWYIQFLNFIITRKKKGYEPTPIDFLLENYPLDKDEAEKRISLRTNLVTLHRHGMVLFYDDIPALRDVVWLDPQGLTKHIQKTILKKSLRHSGSPGIIAEREFEDKIAKDDKIRQLLVAQKVVFLHRPNGLSGEKEYIIPNYLPLADENDPNYQLWVFGLYQPNFTIKFNDFIPIGFINQLICFYGKQPYAKRFWRNQLLFTMGKEGDTNNIKSAAERIKVLIRLDFETLCIKVYIQLQPGSEINREQVYCYLFYSLLSLYWDRWENDIILSYEESLVVLKQADPAPSGKDVLPDEISKSTIKKTRGTAIDDNTENELVQQKHKAWNEVRTNIEYVPADAYLSVDGERYISYKSLFERPEDQYRLPAYLISDGRVDKESGKEVPVAPFTAFTYKKIPSMKKVFISYSHDDIICRKDLQQFLVNIERDGLIEIWQDGLIQAGDDWDKKIKQSLETADICILLLSQSFIASNYVHEVEFKTIMERRNNGSCRIIPVLVKDCDWQHWKVTPPNVLDAAKKDTPEYKIGSYQFLPVDESKRLKPISKWPHAEEAWLQVTEAIRAFCKE